MTTPLRLQDKIAIVTGAGSGIGLAIAKRLHQHGAKLVVADISGKQNELAAELGSDVIPIHTDVSKPDDVAVMIDTAISRFGRIDVLCNNAGIDGEMHMIADFEVDSYDRVMAINLKGVFLGMKYAIPHMAENGGGSIINLASTAGIVATPGLGIYGATKAGVIQLSRSGAVEYASKKIRVNAICPAMIETPLVSALLKTNPEDAARVLAVTPMGRTGLPEEVADVALFLASDESSYVTGVALPVDGAYTAL
jgi:NAD(P)-dependent dehydrogenase (short-subunit alcohol dehydrogenase family)